LLTKKLFIALCSDSCQIINAKFSFSFQDCSQAGSLPQIQLDRQGVPWRIQTELGGE